MAVAGMEFVAFAIRDGITVHATTDETSRVVETLSRNQKVKVIGGKYDLEIGQWSQVQISKYLFGYVRSPELARKPSPTEAKNPVQTDPFDKWIGRNINEYLSMSETPHQILDMDADVKNYVWRWDQTRSNNAYNPGISVNIGSIGKPIWINMGAGSNTSPTKARYWLKFYVSAKSGEIDRYAYKLPRQTIRNLQKQGQAR